MELEAVVAVINDGAEADEVDCRRVFSSSSSPVPSLSSDPRWSSPPGSADPSVVWSIVVEDVGSSAGEEDRRWVWDRFEARCIVGSGGVDGEGVKSTERFCREEEAIPAVDGGREEELDGSMMAVAAVDGLMDVDVEVDG